MKFSILSGKPRASHGAFATLLCAGLFLTSCEKEAPAPLPHTPTPAAVSRTLSDEESNVLEKELQTFNQYTSALAEGTPADPGDLPSTPSLEDAANLIENTFNYYYARLNDDLGYSEINSFSTPVYLDANGNVSLVAVAEAFNQARGKMRTDFDAFSVSDKQLTLVDAAFETANGTPRLTVSYIFQGSHIGSATGFTNYGPFPAGDAWHFRRRGGQQGTNLYDGVYGAPEILAVKVRAQVTSASPTVPLSSNMPVNIQSAVWAPPANPNSNSCPNGITANHNPYATAQPGIGDYIRFWYYFSNTSTSAPNNGYIPALGLNFYLAEQVGFCQQYVNCTNKTFLMYSIRENAIIGNSAFRLLHEGTVSVCNISRVQVPPGPVSTL